MSVTLYVKGFHLPGNENFPELNLASGNWEAVYNLCKLANYQDHDEYSTTGNGDINNQEKLSGFIKEVTQVLNSKKKLSNGVTETHYQDNWVEFGRSEDYLLDKLEKILNICLFAKQRNLNVYWA